MKNLIIEEIGGRLVGAVIAWARRRGGHRILLDVGDWNAEAIALYRSGGFEPTGVVGSLPRVTDHGHPHMRAADCLNQVAR